MSIDNQDRRVDFVPFLVAGVFVGLLRGFVRNDLIFSLFMGSVLVASAALGWLVGPVRVFVAAFFGLWIGQFAGVVVFNLIPHEWYSYKFSRYVFFTFMDSAFRAGILLALGAGFGAFIRELFIKTRK